MQAEPEELAERVRALAREAAAPGQLEAGRRAAKVQRALRRFEKRAGDCLGAKGFTLRAEQRRAVLALLAGQDVRAVTPCGSGKTMMMWSALCLLRGIAVMVVPLNSVADSVHRAGMELGFECVVLHGVSRAEVPAKGGEADEIGSGAGNGDGGSGSDSGSDDGGGSSGSMQLAQPAATAIRAAFVAPPGPLAPGDAGAPRLVIVHPEVAMSAPFREAQRLAAREHRLSIHIFDEAGLSAEWGGDVRGFRPEYGRLAALRVPGVPALVLEACLAPHAAPVVARSVGLRIGDALFLNASVVRTHVKLIAEKAGQVGAQRVAQRAMELHGECSNDSGGGGGGGTLVLHASKKAAEAAAAATEAACLTDMALAAMDPHSFASAGNSLGVTEIGVYHASKGAVDLKQTYSDFEHGALRLLHVTVAIARGVDVSATAGYAPRGASSLSNLLQFVGRLGRRTGASGTAVIAFSWSERCRLLRLALRAGFTDEQALVSAVAGLNELYTVCDAHNPCAMPRCMQRTVSVLMDNPAVRYAGDCDNCTGCDRRQAEEAVPAVAAAAGPPPAKRRKSCKRGTAYGADGKLKGGPQALAAMEDAVRTRVAGEIAPTFDALKLGVFKETGLNAKTVEHWLRMVLCKRQRIKDEPPPLVGSQKPGKWRVLPLDMVTPGSWCTVGGVMISLHHEK
jgi:superfamily II DNA helicase RecQ